MKKLTKFLLIVNAIVFLLSIRCYADDGKTHFNEGLKAYQEAADFDKAISELEQALKLGLNDPDDIIKAHLYLGFAHIAKNQRLHAEVEFGKAIKLDPALKLDPGIYSSKIISVFNYVRERLIDSITVLSNPGGAEVYIDDKLVGITPLKLDDVMTGNRILMVVKEFYQPEILDIEIIKGYDNRFQVELEKNEFSLMVDSEPTGASVYMGNVAGFDNAPSGLTPLALDLVLGQEMSIKLTKEKFLDKEVKINLTDEGFKISDMEDLVKPQDEAANVTIKLDPAPPSGILKVTTEPPGATVYIDGISIGASPIDMDVTPGLRNIRVSAPDFASVTRKVEIFSGKESRLYVVLGGTLFITSLPDGAKVFINDEYKGLTPFKTNTLPPGPHQIRLSKDSYKDNTSTALVEKEQEKEVKIRLQSLKGSVAVSSEPSGANVFMDGKLKGKTPILIYGIATGQHLLKLVSPDYEIWQKQIMVEELKITWQFGNLTKKQEF